MDLENKRDSGVGEERVVWWLLIEGYLIIKQLMS